MHDQTIARPRELRTDGDGVLVLSGYGLKIRVHRRHLVLDDGVGRDRRRGALHRATSGLRRLVVVGHSDGYLTLDALRFVHDIGAAFIHIDSDGQVIACYAPMETNDARLRHAQALATGSDSGLDIARDLIRQKLEGQLRVLRSCEAAPQRALTEIKRSIGDVPTARSADELRWIESRAASAYFTALAPTPVGFVKAELARVPAHWLSFGSRHSPLTGGPMKAVTPAQAMLSYLYAIAGAEARVALLAAGLDPDLPVFHSLRRFRSSLAHDVMEPVRPAVDAYLLELLRARVLSVRDFIETREGVCRLMPELARSFASTAPRWAALLAPIVRHLVEDLRHVERVPQPAQPSRSRPGGALHRLTPRRSLPQPVVGPRPRCAECGGPARDSRNARCLTCERKRLATVAPRLGGAAALARLREAGRDPTHAGAASQRRARTVAARHAEARGWPRTRAQIAADRETFKRDVLPHISRMELAEIVRLTGLSKAQCSLVRRGLRTLHPRHWAVLRSMTTTGSV